MLTLKLDQKTKLTDDDALNNTAAVVGIGFDDPNVIEESTFDQYDSGRDNDLNCGEILTIDPNFIIRFVMIETRLPINLKLSQPAYSIRKPDVAGVAASQTFELLTNTFAPGDAITILGVDYKPGVQFEVGNTILETARNLAAAITDCVEIAVSSKVSAELAGPPNTIKLTSKELGVAGNAFTLAQTGTAFSLGGASFSGGVNQVEQFAAQTVTLRSTGRLFINFGIYDKIEIESVSDENPIKWVVLGQKKLVL